MEIEKIFSIKMRRGNQKNFQQNPIPKQTVLAPASPKPVSVSSTTPINSTPVQKHIGPAATNGETQQEIQFIDGHAEEIKMDLEEKKEDINLEEIEDPKSINLDDTKKHKKTYDLDDTIIRDITLAGDIHVRLLSNTNGYFVDIRKYFKGSPTKKGIRMLATKFSLAADYLKADLQNLIPQQSK